MFRRPRLPLCYRAALAALLAAGCAGPQSALDPAGREAHSIAGLLVWISAAFTLIWLGVVALALHAPRAKPTDERRVERRLVLGGGVAFPVLGLTGVLAVGLYGLPAILAPAPAGRLSVHVTGSQWWWRVEYRPPGGAPVVLANELRLPVGRRVNVHLQSSDVVHSFWVPALAGKMDLIPGRINLLPVEPTRPGTFRGTCAEFCGPSHARMGFVVVAEEPAAFEQWLAAQAKAARVPSQPAAVRGQQAFFAHGCNTCHTVRGTTALGTTAPDLTHVASRHTIAAGTLPATAPAFREWISSTRRIKPGAHMPAFSDLPGETLDALAAYLAQLE
jgi:cytochrome c oxidase subunit 2